MASVDHSSPPQSSPDLMPQFCLHRLLSTMLIRRYINAWSRHTCELPHPLAWSSSSTNPPTSLPTTPQLTQTHQFHSLPHHKFPKMDESVGSSHMAQESLSASRPATFSNMMQQPGREVPVFSAEVFFIQIKKDEIAEAFRSNGQSKTYKKQLRSAWRWSRRPKKQ